MSECLKAGITNAARKPRNTDSKGIGGLATGIKRQPASKRWRNDLRLSKRERFSNFALCVSLLLGWGGGATRYPCNREFLFFFLTFVREYKLKSFSLFLLSLSASFLFYFCFQSDNCIESWKIWSVVESRFSSVLRLFYGIGDFKEIWMFKLYWLEGKENWYASQKMIWFWVTLNSFPSVCSNYCKAKSLDCRNHFNRDYTKFYIFRSCKSRI